MKLILCKTNSEKYIFNSGTKKQTNKNEIDCSIFGNEGIVKLPLSAFSISSYCLKLSRILRLIIYMSMSSLEHVGIAR